MRSLYCHKCGTQLPDDAAFCVKCGTSTALNIPNPTPVSASGNVVAPSGVTSLKCPSCGAPITPKFGEMIISCEYCGSAVTLGMDGWKGIQKQSMLPAKYSDKDQMTQIIRGYMDRGLLHRHLQENSTLEELNVTFVPYWILAVSARTSVVATDMAVEGGEIATTAALMGVLGGMGGRRGGFGGPLLAGAVLGGMMGGPGQNAAKKVYEINDNYYFPIIALKALSQYQPRDYQFNLDDRQIFDVSKIPKNVKILNGDVGEEAATFQAKTLVSQLQSDKAHSQYHMIQQLHTDVDVAESELLYVPIWFARYDHKGNKIILVIDAESSRVINSLGLE